MTEEPQPLIRPFTAIRPTAAAAQAVSAPPYDVVNTEEARAFAAGNPDSFFHASRAEIDLPDATDPYDPAVYAQAGAAFQGLQNRGALVRDSQPAYYVYQMTREGHTQTGLAVAASVAAYEDGRIKRHELTRPAKEDDRVRQIEAVAAHTGPVMTAHRPHAGLAAILQGVAAKAPGWLADCAGTRHSVWPVTDAPTLAAIDAAIAELGVLYIADGHHRSAAAARVAAARQAGRTENGARFDAFLAISFPADAMKILPYNRAVKDLNGLSSDAFLAKVAETFTVTDSPSAVDPAGRGRFGMYLAGQWYALAVKDPISDSLPPAERLDVAVLSARLLEPILGIGDPRRDPRIDFIGGGRGLTALEQRVDGAGWSVSFSCYATAMEDLFAVADAGAIMPPKSTWFEPKLADGLVSLPLDG
ncbi:MAG: DUF1015 domain-containing protein [Magnetospiraceae bacterium]